MVFTYAKNVMLPAFTSVERKSGSIYRWFKRASRINKTGFKKGFRQTAVAGGSGGRKWAGELRVEKQHHSLGRPQVTGGLGMETWFPVTNFIVVFSQAKKNLKNWIIPLIGSGREDTCLGHKTDGAAQEAQLETALALELVLGKGILLQGKN